MKRISIRSAALILGLMGVASCARTQLPPQAKPFVAQFSADDVTRVLAYWSRPDRYTTTVPQSGMSGGPYAARETVEGSLWIWNYRQKTGQSKLPPTGNSFNAAEHPEWAAWINAKVAYDAAVANAQADQMNLRLLGPVGQRATGVGSRGGKRGGTRKQQLGIPARPGICPADLVSLCGDPPPFSEVVAPMGYTVKFDDLEITYEDHIGIRPDYPYFRFNAGVDSEGVAIKELDPARLKHLYRLSGVTDSEARILAAVSSLEGGFDAVNTYDTGYVSVGFIQFASLSEGGGSLGEFLLSYKKYHPAEFDRDLRAYGIDVTPDGLLAAIDPDTGAEVHGEDANALVIRDKRLTATFQRAGLVSDAFMSGQIRAAYDRFFPAEIDVPVNWDGGDSGTVKVKDVIHSEAGMATLLDRNVNRGKIDPFPSALQAIIDQYHCKNAADVLKHERELIQKCKYRRDYLSDKDLSQPADNP